MLQLYIDNQLASQPSDGLDIAVNFAIYDDSSLSNIKGNSTTRTAKLPADKNNQRIFGQYGGVPNGLISAQFELPCRVELSGLPILTGKAFLQKVEYKAGLYQLEPEFYEVLIIGENADFFTNLRGRYLREVVSEPPHIQTAALMTAGLGADYDAGDKYGYCPIQYLPFKVGNEFSASELSPFYFIRAMLDDICADAGYTLNSSFFDSDPFKRLILPLPPVSRYPPEFSAACLNAAATITAPVPLAPFVGQPNYKFPFNLQTLQPTSPFSTNPYNTAAYTYTVQFRGFYRFVATFKFAWDGINGNDQLIIVIYKNNSPAPPPSAIGTATAIQNNDAITLDVVVQADAGDVLDLRFLTNVAVGINQTGLTVTAANVEITGEASYIYQRSDNFVDLAYFTRDWLAIEFIKGLTGLFNLAWQADAVSRTITCEPKDDYTLNLPEIGSQQLGQGFYFGTAESFAHRIDLAQPASLTNEIGKPANIIINFKDDPQDFYTTVANERVEAGAKAGGAWFLPPMLKAEKDVKEDENPFFAATAHRYATEITATAPDGSQINPQIPILFTEGNLFDNYNFEYQPRCLYFRPAGSSINDGWVFYNDGTSTAPRKYQPCFAVNGNDVTGLDWVLHYNGESVQPNNGRGLAYTYYLAEYNRQLLGNTLKCFAFYNAAQINGLTFRQKIRIAQGLFILMSIDNYQPASNAPTQISAVQDNFEINDYFKANQPSTLNVVTLL